MAETNGNPETRLDRRALELLISDHEQFRQDHKLLLIAQVIESEQIAELVKLDAAHTEQIDKHTQQIDKNTEMIAAMGTRVDELVSAIGQLIARVPPSALNR